MTQQLSLIQPELKLQSDYTSVIVNFSTGIDSTGTLYWALQHFDHSKIWLIYCDTGLEYDINDELHTRVAQQMRIKPVLLRYPGGFLGLLNKRGMFPDSKNRWCTSYLKRDITGKWIRHNRHLLGEKVLYLTGERRDESPGRSRLPELQLHPTTLKTERKGKFTCHWMRPVLDYEKGKMFEWGKLLGLQPHPCYEYVNRCSCFACIFMPDRYTAENMKRHPEKFRELIQAEIRHGHTWKQKMSLQQLWEEVCQEKEGE